MVQIQTWIVWNMRLPIQIVAQRIILKTNISHTQIYVSYDLKITNNNINISIRLWFQIDGIVTID